MTEPMRLSSLLKDTQDKLRGAGIETPELDARLLIQEALGLSSTDLMIKDHIDISALDLKRLDHFVTKRQGRMPVSKICGRREFWSLDFIVTKDTLDPRPDSETLIESILEKRTRRDEALTFLDIGTGTGCLIITLLKEFPNARGVAVDISRETLQVAKRNAVMHDVDQRLKVELGFWATYVQGTFDVIVSNPPYIGLSEREALAPEVVNYDPPHALFAGQDGLSAYSELGRTCIPCLNENGFIIFEHGKGQHPQVKNRLGQVGFTFFETRCDLSGTPRVILAATSKKALEQQ